MKPEEFYVLVLKMRKAQKDYFADRTPTNLRVSKDMERRVDQALKELTAPPDLFSQASQAGREGAVFIANCRECGKPVYNNEPCVLGTDRNGVTALCNPCSKGE